jgi:UDP-2-acetamido-2-deoxy-ribo-hexuluronate aminotransferase
VHLFGQSSEMEIILKIAKEHHLYVIEDNAQAIGADYTFSNGVKRKTGSMGDIGCTSFFPSKNLGCFGDGGALFTNNDELAERIRMIANHGQSKRYYHDVVGCNSRLDTLQAAILDIKLKYLDEYNDARFTAAEYYSKAFADNPFIKTPLIAPGNKHVFHQYTLVLEGVDRNKLIENLASVQVPAMIYYPVPAHKQKMFSFLNLPPVNLPETDRLTERVFSLPIHTELDEEQLDYIIEKVNYFTNKMTA